MAFPEKENPAVSSNAGTVEVPAVLESGSEEFLHDLAVKNAEKNRAREEREISEAFQLSHDALEYNQTERVHGLHVAPQHYETDPHGDYEKARSERVHAPESVDPEDVIDRYRQDVPHGEK